MAIRNRLIFWLILVGLLFAGMVYAFWPRSIPVDIAPVEIGKMSVQIEEEGETRVKDIFIVSVPIAGDIDRIDLEAGDQVVSGQTVLAHIKPVSSPSLDPRTEAQRRASVDAARSAVRLAESEIESLAADFNFLAAERDRLKQLYDKGYASKAAFEKADAAVDTAIAALHAAEARLGVRRSELQMARASLMQTFGRVDHGDHIDLKSPIDGVVLLVNRESEGPIVQGTSIMEIGNVDEIEIISDLLSEDAVQVNIGDHVEISGWGGDPISARVKRIEPFAFTKISALGIEEQRVNVIIDLDSTDDADRLGHGYRVDVGITIWSAEDVISIPMTALFRHDNEWTVYVIEMGRAKLRQIEIGHLNARRAEVLSGIQPGSFVIEHPSNRIRDGVKIVDRKAR